MNSARWLAPLFTGLFAAAAALGSAPANDNIANAINAGNSAAATGSGSNVGAGLQSGESSPDTNGAGHTVWWKWTAPSSGTVTVTTYGIGFDSELKLFSGLSSATTFSSLTAVTTSGTTVGNAGTGYKATFTAASGTTYFLQFDGNTAGSTSNADFSGNVHDGTVQFALYRGTYTAPSVSLQSINGAPASGVATGQSMTFDSAASGGGGQSLVYQWYQLDKDGTSVLLTDGTVAIGDFAGETVSGSSTAVLVLGSLPPPAADSTSGTLFGNVILVVANSDGSGSVTSNSGSMTVFYSAANIDTQPVGVTTSTTTNINSGNPASFTVVADGGPLPSFQWRKNTTNVSSGLQASGSTFSVTNSFDANTNLNTSTLTITNATSGDTGTYDCVVSNTTVFNNVSTVHTLTSTGIALTVTGKANQSPPVISSTSTITYPASYTATANTGFGALNWALGSGSNTAGASINSSTGAVMYATAGSFTIKATFAGDSTHNSATSADFTVTVNKASQATLSVISSASGSFNTPYAATATGGSGTGALTWALGTGSTAPGPMITAGGALTTTGAGTVVIHVTKAADANYLVATSADFTVTLAKASQATLTVNSSASGTYGTAYTATATGGSGTGALTWALGTGSTAPGPMITTGGAVTSTGAGTVVIHITKAADANYLVATSANFTIALAKASLTVTAANKTRVFGAANPVFTIGYSGFVNSDTAGSLTTQPTATTSAALNSPAGSYPITPAGGVSSNYAFTYVNGTLTVLRLTAGDFNGDGKSDLIWQNTATGARTIWLMNGTSFSAGLTLTTLSPDWSIAGTGDFNQDGQPDLVWQNTVTGERTIWLMNGNAFLAGVSLGTVSTDWSISAVGDFNGDGMPDLVWQNTHTGERTIWLMNGTAFLGGASLGTVSTDWSIAGAGDFNGDGKTDLLWQNLVTGQCNIWLMNGTGFSGGASLGTVSPELQIAGVGDFNADGQPDILWTNTVTGERFVWLMNGTSVMNSVSVSITTLSLDWVLDRPVPPHVPANADFNGDGHSDLVLQNTSTGERKVWLMNGTTFASSLAVVTLSTDWSIAGTGDFNGDGKPDLVWQNTATGERSIWLMNGNAFLGGVSLGSVSTDWTIAGTGDFNGDGKADLIWQNTVTGTRTIWLLDGGTFLGGVYLGVVPTDWSIAGSGDFNGDGKADLIWQNTATGEREIWLMDGAAFLSGVSLGTVSTDWSIVGAGDFNGNGNCDLIWQNTTTGERVLWLMSGTTFLSGVSLGTVPVQWSIAN